MKNEPLSSSTTLFHQHLLLKLVHLVKRIQPNDLYISQHFSFVKIDTIIDYNSEEMKQLFCTRSMHDSSCQRSRIWLEILIHLYKGKHVQYAQFLFNFLQNLFYLLQALIQLYFSFRESFPHLCLALIWTRCSFCTKTNSFVENCDLTIDK